LSKRYRMKDNTVLQVNLDDDLDTIHIAKLKHHEEQIKYHQGQYKKLLEVLKGKHNGLPTTISSENGSEADYDKSWYWEKRIPQLIAKSFEGKEFKNSDLVYADNVPGLDDIDYRKKVRFAVSIALKSLVEKETLTYREKSGIKGYLYKKV